MKSKRNQYSLAVAVALGLAGCTSVQEPSVSDGEFTVEACRWPVDVGDAFSSSLEGFQDAVVSRVASVWSSEAKLVDRPLISHDSFGDVERWPVADFTCVFRQILFADSLSIRVTAFDGRESAVLYERYRSFVGYERTSQDLSEIESFPYSSLAAPDGAAEGITLYCAIRSPAGCQGLVAVHSPVNCDMVIVEARSFESTEDGGRALIDVVNAAAGVVSDLLDADRSGCAGSRAADA